MWTVFVGYKIVSNNFTATYTLIEYTLFRHNIIYWPSELYPTVLTNGRK